MKKLYLFFIFIFTFNGCERDEVERINYIIGNYYGEKIIKVHGSLNDFKTTITINFDSSKYSYSGYAYGFPPDYGSGKYLIYNDTIVLNDDLRRTADLTWDWILVGKFKYKLFGDSLLIMETNSRKTTSCKLMKVKK